MPTKKKPKSKQKQAISVPGFLNLLKSIRKLFGDQFKTSIGILIVHLILQLVLARNLIINQVDQVYAVFIIVIVSLAWTWHFRRVAHREDTDIKRSFYFGNQAFVPFLLLLILISIQLLPFAFGSFIFNIAVGGGVAVNGLEILLFAVLWGLISVPSLYWITASSMALFTVSLPGVGPWEGYIAAKKIVEKSRVAIFWRLIYLAVMLGLLTGGIMIFLLYQEMIRVFLISPSLLIPIIMPITIGYLYSIYRELL